MHRPFDKDRDRADLVRIWSETGWKKGQPDFDRGLDAYLKACDTIVEEHNGSMEVGASRTAGTLQFQTQQLPVVIIAGVYASVVCRQGGHASTLTAMQVAAGVADGAAVASLGIFDQGFYDRLGFSCCPYVRRMTIEPASLKVARLDRLPVRLSVDDAAEMHACRLGRRHMHGMINLADAGLTELECCECPGHGLGFRDAKGVLTHAMWISVDDNAEDGPWSVRWMAWSTRAQLHELLGVIRSFADQVSGVRIADPPGVQLQDLVDRPFAWLRRTRGGQNEGKPTSIAYQQHRMCDVPTCMAALSLPGKPLSFNLRLHDPIEGFLPTDAPWRGCGGDWTVTLGEQCIATQGHDANAPMLEASINAFTRLWMGARSATALALTDDLRGPGDLLAALTSRWLLPEPAADWDY